jgi:diaminopimelate decarboxylase
MIDFALAHSLASQHQTPLYVYDGAQLRDRALQLASLHLPFGFTARYAVKANPHPEIIRLFAGAGLQFDASSSYEAAYLLEQGIPGEKISLSSQQPAHNLPELLAAGVRYVATSQRQLELFAEAAQSGAHAGLRVNPGMGSGHNNRTTTGGLNSSFGLWHAYLPEVLALAQQHQLVIDTLHVHVGSGADPAAWGTVMDQALEIAARLPDVTVLDIGGGYKIQRAEGEKETDMQEVAAVFANRLSAFAAKTGRQLHLEIEPGTWLVAHGGTLLAEIVDIVDTGAQGHTFLRINTGMNDFLRPTLYGAQHGIEILNGNDERADYVVVGHNCETGDILTPAPGDPEGILPRRLRKADIGNLIVIADTGAYCASLRAQGYNAYPSARELFIAPES